MFGKAHECVSHTDSRVFSHTFEMYLMEIHQCVYKNILFPCLWEVLKTMYREPVLCSILCTTHTCLVMYVMWCTGTRVHVKPQLLGLYCQKSLSLLSVFHSITVHPGNVRIRPLRTPNKPSCIRDPLL